MDVESNAKSDSVKESDWPENESRIDLIGCNGNTGDHYFKPWLMQGDYNKQTKES